MPVIVIVITYNQVCCISLQKRENYISLVRQITTWKNLVI